MRLNRRSLRSAHSEHSSTRHNRPITRSPGSRRSNRAGATRTAAGTTGSGHGAQGFGGNTGNGNGNGYGNYSGHDGLYRAYGGPAAEHSERFAEWEKEELRAHEIELLHVTRFLLKVCNSSIMWNFEGIFHSVTWGSSQHQ